MRHCVCLLYAMKSQHTFKNKFFHTITNYYIISKRNQMNQDKRKKQNPPTGWKGGPFALF